VDAVQRLARSADSVHVAGLQMIPYVESLFVSRERRGGRPATRRARNSRACRVPPTSNQQCLTPSRSDLFWGYASAGQYRGKDVGRHTPVGTLIVAWRVIAFRASASRKPTAKDGAKKLDAGVPRRFFRSAPGSARGAFSFLISPRTAICEPRGP
jgi:hypothetical protein